MTPSEKDVYFDVISQKDLFIFRVIYIEGNVSMLARLSKNAAMNTFTLDE